MQIDCTGDALELRQNAIGEGTAGLDVVAGDLKVDGRGKTEVQDLSDDVGGQKVEGDAWKLARQIRSQRANVFRGRPVLWIQGDENVAVGGADLAGFAVGKVDLAVRQTDVVENS